MLKFVSQYSLCTTLQVVTHESSFSEQRETEREIDEALRYKRTSDIYAQTCYTAEYHE